LLFKDRLNYFVGVSRNGSASERCNAWVTLYKFTETIQ